MKKKHITWSTKILQHAISNQGLIEPLLKELREKHRNEEASSNERPNTTGDEVIEPTYSSVDYEILESDDDENPMQKAEQLLNSKRDAVNEKQSDNRLGGSSFAYKQNYRPVDPRIQPQPYDSIWG